MTKREYRVLTPQATELEEALNHLGAEGWDVVGTHFDRIAMHPHIGNWSAEVVQVTAVLKRLVR